MKAEAIISEVQRDVASTQAVVRDMLNQDWPVSDTRALLATGRTLTPPRLKTGQWSQPLRAPASHVCI